MFCQKEFSQMVEKKNLEIKVFGRNNNNNCYFIKNKLSNNIKRIKDQE